jgi:ATP-dependent protease ClpP protease subunit
MSKAKDIDKEKLRLDYLFEQGINFVDRVIQINEEIGEASFAFLDAALSELERSGKKTITIRINSPGGSVYDALAMVGRIKASNCRVVTEAYGHVMSAATLLLAAGRKRTMSKYCVFMAHQMSYYIGGSHAETKEEVEQVEKQERQWCLWMSELSNKDAEFWYNQTYKKNLYLTPDECLEYGVIDEII